MIEGSNFRWQPNQNKIEEGRTPNFRGSVGSTLRISKSSSLLIGKDAELSKVDEDGRLRK